MGLIPVAAGEVATIVTTLEMRERPAVSVPASPLRLEPWAMPVLERYRALFRTVGAPWLWFSRLVMEDARLAAIVHDPEVQVFAVMRAEGGAADGGMAGMLELDFRAAGACELSYVGLVPALAGRGHGRWLMAEALTRAWRPDVGRVWVHTCTLDHPGALRFYRREGFTPIMRTVETFPDPRLNGILPHDAAPHVPLLG